MHAWIDPQNRDQRRQDQNDTDILRRGYTATLTYIGHESLANLYGWFYGYPPCCVANFRALMEHFKVGAKGVTADQPAHPTRGHLMCPTCRINPAPLPERHADRWRLDVQMQGRPRPLLPPDYDDGMSDDDPRRLIVAAVDDVEPGEGPEAD